MQTANGPGGIFRVGCDIGGTFTDFVLLDESNGRISTAKVLTTPADPSAAVLDGLARLGSASPGYVGRTRRIAHASTLVANAVIERKGARCALLCTSGFRDVLEVRRHVRVTTYELWADPPEPLVSRRFRLPINERTLSSGKILRPIRPDEIRVIADILKREAVQSVAIAFLHSYVNPKNERDAARLLREMLPGIEITLSSDILPQIKEYERTSTTVVNAYVKPIAKGYLSNLVTGCRQIGFSCPVHIMLSNGGLASPQIAGEFPIRSIESGPVAGALIARHYGQLTKLENVLAFDMGGTTAKACLIRGGEIPVTNELEVARSHRFTRSSGFPIGVPAAHLIEVGAGGGSIATVNALGLVQVGPESAAANPGPVCYGRGGDRPTVTDADLTLGFLNPDYFSGGDLRLDAVAARQVIETQIVASLGRDAISAAWTIHDVINEVMAAAVRMHVTERGGVLDDVTLVAFGGAGPVHAYNMAAKLGIGTVLVPLRAGVLSAVGLLVAPPAYDLVRTLKIPLVRVNPDRIDDEFEDMAKEVSAVLAEVEEGQQITFSRVVEIGYIGQGYQVAVSVPGPGPQPLEGASLWRMFADVYRKKYGYFYDDVPAELVSLRLTGCIAGGQLVMQRLDSTADEPRRSAQRLAFSRRRRSLVTYDVKDRSALKAGTQLRGPLLVEEASSTTVVDDGGSLEVDEFGSLIVKVLPEGTL